jgi:hypothetical protein
VTSPEPLLLEILIEQELLDAVDEFVARATGECSWFGIGCPHTLYIDRVVVPEQTCSGASTEPTDKAMAEIISGLGEGEAIIWWGHSHANMKNFFSSTDWDTWGDMLMGRPDYMPLVATVHNKKDDQPHVVAFIGGYTIDDIQYFPLTTLEPETDPITDQWLTKIKKPKTPQTYNYTPKNGGGLYQKSYVWGMDR